APGKRLELRIALALHTNVLLSDLRARPQHAQHQESSCEGDGETHASQERRDERRLLASLQNSGGVPAHLGLAQPLQRTCRSVGTFQGGLEEVLQHLTRRVTAGGIDYAVGG